MVQLDLTADDLRLAVSIGCERQIQNIAVGRAPRYGNDDSRPWQDHIEGAIGEYCVAMVLGIFWNGSLGDMGAKDVGQVQVRTTRHPRGRLLVHDEDSDDDVFILVRGSGHTWHVVGWCYGRDAHEQEFFDRTLERPCYAVPGPRLRKLSELKRLIVGIPAPHA